MKDNHLLRSNEKKEDPSSLLSYVGRHEVLKKIRSVCRPSSRNDDRTKTRETDRKSNESIENETETDGSQKGIETTTTISQITKETRLN